MYLTASVRFCSPTTRVHDAAACYHYGYVEDGQHNNAAQSGPCPGGPPAENQWVELTAVVTGNTVRVYLDLTFVFEFTAHFAAKPWVGDGVFNGFSNIVYFKDLQVEFGECMKSFVQGFMLQ